MSSQMPLDYFQFRFPAVFASHHTHTLSLTHSLTGTEITLKYINRERWGGREREGRRGAREREREREGGREVGGIC